SNRAVELIKSNSDMALIKDFGFFKGKPLPKVDLTSAGWATNQGELAGPLPYTDGTSSSSSQMETTSCFSWANMFSCPQMQMPEFSHETRRLLYGIVGAVVMAGIEVGVLKLAAQYSADANQLWSGIFQGKFDSLESQLVFAAMAFVVLTAGYLASRVPKPE